MSDHQCGFMIYFVVVISCVLHLCISSTFIITDRQKRYEEGFFCQESQKTVEIVNKCPQNDMKFEVQSIIKQCNRYPACNGKQLVYHCVRSGEMLVEVCAPRHTITGRCCPVYNKILGRVIEDYNKRCSKCPFQYGSDECVKNEECVKLENKEQVSNVTSEDNNTKQDPENNMNPAVIIPIVLGGMTILCFCLPFIYRYRNCLATVCFRHEDRLENNQDKKDSLKLQCNDLICRESSETMNREDEYEPFRQTSDFQIS